MVLMLFHYTHKSLWSGDNYHPSNSHVMASLIRKFSEAKNKQDSKVICWGTGSPLRGFMHVKDLANNNFLFREMGSFRNKCSKDKDGYPLHFLNVGTGKDISIFDLLEKYQLL